jgi:hypothetical protein
MEGARRRTMKRRMRRTRRMKRRPAGCLARATLARG